jgi:uncharacterized protein with PIN domain
MKLTRAQKRAKLQAAAERLIEQLLDWDEQAERPNLTQIEEAVLPLRQQFGQAMACVLVDGQEARQPVAQPSCPQCGQPLRDKGRKRKVVESRVGSLQVERGYYYCPDCASGSFPPRRPTGVGE